ncbi:MAG: pyridoxal-dependent decarboxylase [Ruminococcus sp.]|nr:pyridoxal-dependent decarboxylase [Ruminococcus sp.]
MNKSVLLQTPYFLINKNELDSNLKYLIESLENAWDNYIIGYSYKTNSLPWVANFFRICGCYAEVVSDDEYNLACSLGVDRNQIIYNGIAKSKESFLEAVKSHAIVNIDSEYEIDWLDELVDGEYNVGVRVNFDLESKCPGQTQCGKDGERFGFCYENGELKKAIDRIESKGIKVTGLHLHKSSKTRMPDIYKAIAEIAVEISRKYKLNLSYVDIGGGFFGGLKSKPQFPEYFDMVAEILGTHFDPKSTTLIVEPGMALIGAPIDFVTTVVDVKRTSRNVFVVTDGGRTQIDPLMTKSSYFYEVSKMDNKKRKCLKRQIISGFTCMEHDRLFDIIDDEELLPGDMIVYHKVGAYTIGLSPLFIKWFPDVYVKDGEKISKVRDKWTENDYKSRSISE